MASAANISGNQLRIGSHSIVNANIAFEEKKRFGYNRRSMLYRPERPCLLPRILIGNDVIISWGATWWTMIHTVLTGPVVANDAGRLGKGAKALNNVMHAPIAIEDKVWIGFNASLLKGVTIDEGAVIGAARSSQGIFLLTASLRKSS